MSVASDHTLIPLKSGKRVKPDRRMESALLKLELAATKLELLSLRVERIEQNREFLQGS